jgi:tRNA-2-methylthio-N6-dimethylallyladenosine synthase
MSQPYYHLITFGCQMNKSDSERMDALFLRMGFLSTDDRNEADLILINTCSVRQSAEDRVFGLMRQVALLKEKNPNLLIGITGCMPGRDRTGVLRKKFPHVDFFFPISDLPQLPRWIGELHPEWVNSTDFSDDYLKIHPLPQGRKQVFVTIQTGCNKFCTYCVVPFSRGFEKNRPVQDILHEIHSLAADGCVEVTLLGQTVNSYRAPDPEHFSSTNPYQDHFAALLWEINQISGILRLHFTAPHPLHMSDETVDAMTLPTHVNFLHIPVQSGDNEVLRRMNRRYTREQFMEIIAYVRAKIPTIAIGTDIIVGFCGETEEQFEQTVDLYRHVRFDISYTAIYSPRTGTAAYRAFKDDVSREEKRRRWNVLQELMEQIVLENNQAYIGKKVSVLVERHEPSKITDELLTMPGNIREKLMSQPGTCIGNSREMKMVQFPGGKEFVGKVVDVLVEEAKEWVLRGR